MQKYDATVLAQNLNALAEVFDRKPVSAKALEVWFDTLKEFPTEKVMGKLINWPKSHTKFPAPSEVWKECNDLGAKDREDKAARERAENLRDPVADDAVARANLSRIRALLSRPRKSAAEYWEMVLKDAPKGSMAEQAANEYLGRHGRESGQGNEEKAVNF